MTEISQKITPQDDTAEISQLRSKVVDLSSLIELSIIINSTLNVDKLVNLVIEKAQTVMGAEASSVLLLNEQTNMLECEVALGEVGDKVKTIQLALGEGIAGWVAEHGEPQLIQDVMTDSRFSGKVDNSTGFKTRSILAAPLTVKDKVIGVAEVINRKDGRAFNKGDLELFSTFCRQVAMAIDNAKMHQLALEKERYQQELENAKIIQQSFMPGKLEENKDRKFSISAQSLSAEAVGGDLYDYYEFDNHTVGIALGDVTGKGVPAALYMARFVSDLRRYAQVKLPPNELIHELNKALVDRSHRGMFVTFQYGILDTNVGVFRYANAGHLPFLLVDKKGGVKSLNGGKTIPLGITEGFTLELASEPVKAGDSLVLITDGIIEASNSKGERFGLDRTFKILSESPKHADAIVDNLLNSVQDFSLGTQQHDDLTILSLTIDEF